MKYIKKYSLLESNDESNNKFKVSDINFITHNAYDYDSYKVDITELIGKVITDIKFTDKEILIEIDDFNENCVYYLFKHEQDCCEQVWLDDISGYLDDIIERPILKAEERISKDEVYPKSKRLDSSVTWTFYTIATFNGYVDLRWVGTSNGYYSESISIYKLTNF